MFPEVPNLNKNQFSFLFIKYIMRHGSMEPNSGSILVDNVSYDFKFSHEYSDGNAYIVYDDNVPIYYFTIDFSNEEPDKYHIDDFRKEYEKGE